PEQNVVEFLRVFVAEILLGEMRATFDQPQTRRRRAERTSNKDLITRLRARSLHRHSRGALADRDRVDHDMLVSARSIAADQLHTVTIREVQPTVIQSIDKIGLPNIFRHPDRYQAPERSRSHRCKIRK